MSKSKTQAFIDRDGLLKTQKFDGAWYSSQYPDVGALDLDAEEHFLTWGRLFNRSPGPDFDAKFYSEIYAHLYDQNSAFYDYLLAEDRENRPVTRDEAKEMRARLDEETEAEWGPVGPLEVSYCIPVKNRLSDLKVTLRANLNANDEFRDRIEFLIITFDQDTQIQDWIEATFPDDLADGYLRVIAERDLLDTWHFGKAKNAFRKHLLGKVYSSLDGDNFVTRDETAWLLRRAAHYDLGFIAHHFSGNWGDGTSGRISMPSGIYRRIGYDPLFFPRQYDEVGLMLSALKAFPWAPFLVAQSERNLFSLSGNVRSFIERERLPNKQIIEVYPNRRLPANPKGGGYVDKSPHLRDMNNYNAAVMAWRNCDVAERKAKYASQIATHRALLIQSIPQDDILDTVFDIQGRPEVPEISGDDLSLFACVKDDQTFLPDLVAHYRALGVRHFFLIDNDSEWPVANLDLGPGVYVFRPKIGYFFAAKTLWIELLMRVFIPEGAWTLTVDADEFIQMPEPFLNLPQIADHLTKEGREFASALMLDMVPSDMAHAEGVPDIAFKDVFDSFLWYDGPITDEYADTASIRWAFGASAELSWRADIRFHAFGTFDCLRKVPLLRYRPGQTLNQGFHTVTFPGAEVSADADTLMTEPMLPMFHYKLLRLFSDGMRADLKKRSGGYHHRTQVNIQRMLDAHDSVMRLSEYADHLRPAGDALKEGFLKPRHARLVK